MSLKNIKSNTQNQKGFTIVELLIVVVVIAILAAITIVSYNGITNRANQSASKATAATVQKKAELYNSEIGNYPFTQAQLTSATSDKSYALPSSALTLTAPDATNGKTKVQLIVCGTQASPQTASTVTGVKIAYWDFGASGSAAAVTNIDVGNVTVTSPGVCAAAPAS